MLTRAMFTALGFATVIGGIGFVWSHLKAASSNTGSVDLAVTFRDNAIDVRYGGGAASLIGLPLTVAGLICIMAGAAFVRRMAESAPRTGHILIGLLGAFGLLVLGISLTVWGLYVLFYRRNITIGIAKHELTIRHSLVVPLRQHVYQLDQFDKMIVTSELHHGARRATYLVYPIKMQGVSQTVVIDQTSLTDPEKSRSIAERISFMTGLSLHDDR